MSIKQPSFFVVGAPKAGTTALCKYLARHPEIFIPQRKELNYFNKGSIRTSLVKTLEEYLCFFAEGAGKICGEGSTVYLRSPNAAREIYNFNPNAKIIIMLREPVALLRSFHSQLLWNGSSEDIEDFQTAILAEENRRKGLQIPEKCHNPQVLFYSEIVDFTEQIERYLEYFSWQQINIILFDDFTKNTAEEYKKTLMFLNADESFATHFNKINPKKKVKSKFIQELYKRPPEKILKIGKYFLPIPREQRKKLLNAIKDYLQQFNQKEIKNHRQVNSDFLVELNRKFSSEIDRLSELINRDLSHWKK